jgi:glycosyltransferase involved in cell wall biosynthesis
MDNSPLVTCVTIFLDAGLYIEEALESIFRQSYRNWELVLVDDGSTDASSEIARGYAERHPDRVRYVEHPGHANRGMSASRNLGISLASGKYLALLDADDVWLPGKLAGQVEAMEARPEAAMVLDASLHWYSWTGDPEAAARERIRGVGFPAGTLVGPPEYVPRFLLGMAETPGTCSVLVRREAVERVGGFVEAFKGMYEDQAFFYKICLEFPVLVADGHSALYRQHPDSHSHLAEKTGLYDPAGANPAREVFLDWLADHVAGRIASPDSPARLLEDWVKTRILERRSKVPRLFRWARDASRRGLSRMASCVRLILDS